MQPFAQFDDMWTKAETEKSSRDVVVKDGMLTFEKNLFVMVNPTEPMPFSLDRPGEADDELEVAGGVVNLTCPISRKLMENPVLNSNCTHCYDYKSVVQFIRSAVGGRCTCPECNAPLNTSDLVTDELMALRIHGYNRDQRLESFRKKNLQDNLDRL